MRRQILTVAGVLVALSQYAGPYPTAWAQVPDPLDGQTDEDRAGARERARLALQKGRALDQKGDLAGALQTFREAAPLDPENPTLLFELGWAAFRSRDLALAETATQKATQYASEPRLLATAQYNLGRIYEERGNLPKAIEAYLDSLHTRSTPEARLRLEPLIPAGQPPTFKPMTRVGSFAEFCQQTHTDCPDEPSRVDDSRFGCVVATRIPAKAPYQDVQLWTTSCQDGSESQTGYSLAVRLAKGWFVAANVLTGGNRKRETAELHLKELALRPPGVGPGVTTRSPVLVWRSQEVAIARDRSPSRETTTELDYLLIAGVGPSGVPSYSDPVRLATAISSSLLADDAANKGTYTRGGALQYKFLPDGQLELAPAAKQTRLDLMLADEELTRHLGRQRLAFP